MSCMENRFWNLVFTKTIFRTFSHIGLQFSLLYYYQKSWLSFYFLTLGYLSARLSRLCNHYSWLKVNELLFSFSSGEVPLVNVSKKLLQEPTSTYRVSSTFNLVHLIFVTTDSCKLQYHIHTDCIVSCISL